MCNYCQCGCGGEIVPKPHHSYLGVPRFIRGHHVRGMHFTRSDAAKKKNVENIKKFWAGLTPEQKADFCARRAKKLKNFWANATPEYKEERGRKSVEAISTAGWQAVDEAQARRWASPEARKHFSKMLSENWKSLSEEDLRERKKKHSDGARRAWRDGKLEYTGTKTRTHTCPSGREIRVQSSWESSFADFCDVNGIKFDRGPRIDLGSCGWTPDFLVQDSIFVEIKGHPLAKKQFDTKQFVALTAPQQSACNKPVGIVDFNIAKSKITSFEDLIRVIKWVSVPPSYAFAPERLYFPGS